MRPSVSVSSPSAESDAPTHPCVRCGAPIPLDESLCERCNPLGLPAPASSQAHGSIFVAIVVSVLGLAIVGHLLTSGSVGPFRASVTSVQAVAPGLNVTIAISNEGSRAGTATCRIFDPSLPGIGPDSGYLLSPPVPAGQTLSFSGEVTQLGPTIRTVAADCR